MSCGYVLKWYDLFPLFSYLILGGKCRKCSKKLSPQYPLVEFINGLFYVLVFYMHGITIESILFALLTSGLIVLSIIDFRTYEIPVGINIFILILGVLRNILDYQHITDYVLGFVSVSGFLLLLYILTKGRGIGGGDIKLMAVVGLLLGLKLTILAFLLGCILGSIIHVIRMKVKGADSVLAFGPYLSLGIFITILFGNQIITWYLDFLL
jgi:leader peptidase (prepilin peptidase)/N-methyltransferase